MPGSPRVCIFFSEAGRGRPHRAVVHAPSSNPSGSLSYLDVDVCCTKLFEPARGLWVQHDGKEVHVADIELLPDESPKHRLQRCQCRRVSASDRGAAFLVL